MNKNAFMLKRRVPLNQHLTPEQTTALSQLQTDLELDKLAVKATSVTLRYNAADIQWPQIEFAMREIGVIQNVNWWLKLRFHWYQYVDENAKSNALSKEAHCCNKAPAVPKRK